MSAITTHVLDTAEGRPAANVAVHVERLGEGGWESIARARTDDDGRARDLLDCPLELGVYRLTFDTGQYFEARGQKGFYPEVTIAFEVRDQRHHHVPLLLSPFGYSTYRGS